MKQNEKQPEIKLTEKQKIFCLEYIVDFNGAHAAIRAGYSKKTAGVIANENLNKPYLQNHIRKLIDKRADKTGVTSERVIEEFKKIAFSSIAHLHNTWISLKEFEDLTDDQKDTIESIKTRIRSYKENEELIKVEEIQIKLYDKVRALENLGKHTGIYEADNKQKPIIPITGMEIK